MATNENLNCTFGDNCRNIKDGACACKLREPNTICPIYGDKCKFLSEGSCRHFIHVGAIPNRGRGGFRGGARGGARGGHPPNSAGRPAPAKPAKPAEAEQNGWEPTIEAGEDRFWQENCGGWLNITEATVITSKFSLKETTPGRILYDHPVAGWVNIEESKISDYKFPSAPAGEGFYSHLTANTVLMKKKM